MVVGFRGNLASHPYFTRSKGSIGMSSEMTLPTIPITDDSPISGIPTSESAATEENRILRIWVMEMWDSWANGREPPSAIPGFPELFPRSGGTSNVPISHPNTPLGHPTISAHFVGMPSEVRPQVFMSGAASNIFTSPPCSATVQPILPRPSFDPSAFTFQTPTFQMEPSQFPTYTYPQPPQFEFTAGQEKTTKTPKQEDIAKNMRSMEQSLKNIQGLSGQKSVSYVDLCMFPHVHLPLGFKTPKFENYDRRGDPIAHLKKYCNQLRGAGGKEELLMAYFGESLIGIASEWYMDQDIYRWHIWDDLARDFVRQFQYNIDIAPDRNSLTNLKKKSSESFREDAVKWREQVSRVKPLMDEVEMVIVFLQGHEADYFQNMMSVMGKSFAEAIKIGEMVENGSNSKPIRYQSYFPSHSGWVWRNSERREKGRNIHGSVGCKKTPYSQIPSPRKDPTTLLPPPRHGLCFSSIHGHECSTLCLSTATSQP
ncbi:uncharacterized protein [Nicotiana sylvestris]|uniref:uncharacterized protein n=1 Tax=Nicotiana sylvestris TaxID=4096 RepID=UPI00388C3E00